MVSPVLATVRAVTITVTKNPVLKPNEWRTRTVANSPMKHLFWKFYWAEKRTFLRPGLYIWAFGDNRRIIPIPKRNSTWVQFVVGPDRNLSEFARWGRFERCPHRLRRDQSPVYFGRCDLKKGHADCHVLERGMEMVEWVENGTK